MCFTDRVSETWVSDFESAVEKWVIKANQKVLTTQRCSKFKKKNYRGSPHRTEKWEAENTVLCETVLFLIEYRDIAKPYYVKY